MSERVFIVTVPQLGVNDKTTTIVEYFVQSESKVNVGESFCSLETTKSVFDVEAEASGYLVHLAEVGSVVEVSQPIALIGENLENLRKEKEKYEIQRKKEKNVPGETTGEFRATKKAISMARELGVDLTQVSASEIIREKEVLKFYEENLKESDYGFFDIQQLEVGSNENGVIIYGAGRGATTYKECLDLQNKYRVMGFLEDNIKLPRKHCGLPVFKASQLQEIQKRGVPYLACAIANGAIRLSILKRCEELSITVINVIHPRVYMAPTSKIGKGNFIKTGAVIETNSKIGNGCIIDNNVIIPHDNKIGDGCHLAPGVTLGSGIEIGKLTIVGIGASIATGVKIGESSIISVGSSVVKDVPPFSVIEGVPGKIVGTKKSH